MHGLWTLFLFQLKGKYLGTCYIQQKEALNSFQFSKRIFSWISLNMAKYNIENTTKFRFWFVTENFSQIWCGNSRKHLFWLSHFMYWKMIHFCRNSYFVVDLPKYGRMVYVFLEEFSFSGYIWKKKYCSIEKIVHL